MRYFGTDGIRDKADALLASGAPFRLGAALSKGGGKIIVAKDTRLSSDEVERQLVSGLLTGDAQILLAGVLPTPALAYIAEAENADRAVMITASHNPPEFNGLKVFGRRGKKLTRYEEEALDGALCLACEHTPSSARPSHGVRVLADAQKLYKAHILEGASPLDGVKLRLDVAYGCYAGLAKGIFEALGGDVVCENDVRDGTKVNVNCGSTAADSFAKRVAWDEIGFAFDGDGDRVIAVVNGKVYDGDAILLTLATAYRVQGKLKKKLVVGTTLSNSRLQKELADQNIALIRADVGDKNVLDALEQAGCPLGGEKSGHILMLDRANTGDGVLTALALLEARRVLGGLPDYDPYPTLQLNLPVDSMDEQALLARLKEAEKLLGSGGRVTARKSGTEPCVRLTFECFSRDCEGTFAKLKDLFLL